MEILNLMTTVFSLKAIEVRTNFLYKMKSVGRIELSVMNSITIKTILQEYKVSKNILRPMKTK